MQIDIKPLLNAKYITQPWNFAIKTDLHIWGFQVRQLQRIMRKDSQTYLYRSLYLYFPQSSVFKVGCGGSFFVALFKKRDLHYISNPKFSILICLTNILTT